jgi:hypothetical protein
VSIKVINKIGRSVYETREGIRPQKPQQTDAMLFCHVVFIYQLFIILFICVVASRIAWAVLPDTLFLPSFHIIISRDQQLTLLIPLSNLIFIFLSLLLFFLKPLALEIHITTVTIYFIHQNEHTYLHGWNIYMGPKLP